MGLDQYLSKKLYVKSWEHQPESERYSVIVKLGDKTVKTEDVTYITEEVGYWRKANQIHKWFVTNVQGDKDDCRDYPVSIDQLKELLATVTTVLDGSQLVKGKIRDGYTFDESGNKVYNLKNGQVVEDSTLAEELLPTTTGFFFGSEDYDQYYWKDLKDTKKMLEQIVKQHKIEYEYEYRSSW